MHLKKKIRWNAKCKETKKQNLSKYEESFNNLKKFKEKSFLKRINKITRHFFSEIKESKNNIENKIIIIKKYIKNISEVQILDENKNDRNKNEKKYKSILNELKDLLKKHNIIELKNDLDTIKNLQKKNSQKIDIILICEEIRLIKKSIIGLENISGQLNANTINFKLECDKYNQIFINYKNSQENNFSSLSEDFENKIIEINFLFFYFNYINV